MRNFTALLVIFFLVVSFCGCTDKETINEYSETQEQCEIRETFEKNLKNLYSCPEGYMFEKYIEPISSVISDDLTKDMSLFMGGTIKFLSSHTLFVLEELTVYDITFVLEHNTGEREFYHDRLITRDNDGKRLVVLQWLLDESAQKQVIEKLEENTDLSEQLYNSSLKSFFEESKSFKEWYEKRENSIKVKQSALSVSGEVKIAQTVYNRGGRTLVWSEEFENAKSLSDTKMTYKRTMRNPSLLITTDDSNLSFQDGTMTMYARPTDEENYHYSVPDGITTYQSMAYVGGYLEMRAKVPFEHGAWPGFWELAYPGAYETLYGAEIDIFEVFSDETSLACNLHKWGSEHVSGGIGTSKKFSFSSNEEATDWHNYGFEWTDTEYKFYIDGECYCTLYVDNEHDFGPSMPGMEGFQDLHYVALNCFIFNNYSSWAPEGSRLSNDETKVIEYTVDYIRLYQNKETDKIIIFK